MTFDEQFGLHKKTWDEAYLGILPMVPHIKASSEVSIYQLLKKHPEVKLTVFPGDESETIKVIEGTLVRVLPTDAPAFLATLFDQTLTYSGYMFSPEIKSELPGLIEAFLKDFEDPIIFANSGNPAWKSRIKVTHQVLDFLVVLMDKQNFRYILGVVGD